MMMMFTVESVNVISDYEEKGSLCPTSIFTRGSVSNIFCFSEIRINVGLCTSHWQLLRGHVISPGVTSDGIPKAAMMSRR